MAQRTKRKATNLARLPAAATSRRLPFTKAVVRPGFVTNTHFLMVSGTKPYINMRVSLCPLVYVTTPDYWGIEVVGTLEGIGLPATAPYTEAIPLDGIIGHKGIEVIGSNKRKKIRVP
jgi:hypothetical protein